MKWFRNDIKPENDQEIIFHRKNDSSGNHSFENDAFHIGRFDNYYDEEEERHDLVVFTSDDGEYEWELVNYWTPIFHPETGEAIITPKR